MRVLVLGSGAREHALATAIARTADVIVAPGNAGIADATRAPLAKLDAESIVRCAKETRADLVVVGPEAPLVAGAADALRDANILTFGPNREGAKLEGSKSRLKAFAKRHGIPTADFDVARSFDEAEASIRRRGAPIVVKADGLCAGKGVVVAATVDEARAAAKSMLVDRVFGDAGATVVIEECLRGEEASVHALTDGKELFVLPVARDHKRVFDGDRGPNTGGMGVVAPSARVSSELVEEIERTILRPTIEGLAEENVEFRGVLFAGLMIPEAGAPMLLEYNVRFGDPECEALMSLLEGDVAALLASCARGSIDAGAVRVAKGEHACVVVLASEGYPEAPKTGDVISFPDRVPDGVRVFHAGTTKRSDGAIVTSGGRVLAVTATSRDAARARSLAYEAADAIAFRGKHCRRDIGA